jgi:hypothetical protein
VESGVVLPSEIGRRTGGRHGGAGVDTLKLGVIEREAQKELNHALNLVELAESIDAITLEPAIGATFSLLLKKFIKEDWRPLTRQEPRNRHHDPVSLAARTLPHRECPAADDNFGGLGASTVQRSRLETS